MAMEQRPRLEVGTVADEGTIRAGMISRHRPASAVAFGAVTAGLPSRAATSNGRYGVSDYSTPAQCPSRAAARVGKALVTLVKLR